MTKVQMYHFETLNYYTNNVCMHFIIGCRLLCQLTETSIHHYYPILTFIYDIDLWHKTYLFLWQPGLYLTNWIWPLTCCLPNLTLTCDTKSDLDHNKPELFLWHQTRPLQMKSGLYLNNINIITLNTSGLLFHTTIICWSIVFTLLSLQASMIVWDYTETKIK